MLRKGLMGCALVVTLTAPDAFSSNNPYQGIVSRNVFQLQPLTTQETPPPVKDPPPKIILGGVTDVVGRKLALFKVQYQPKSGQPAKEESFTLAEGQRAGEIEIVRIDQNAGAITVNNHGSLMLLTLEKDGAKLPTGPPVPALGAPPVAAGMPPGVPQLHTNAVMRPVTTRQIPAPPGTPPMSGEVPAGTTSPVPTQATQEKPLTPEQQILLMELQREATKNQVQSGSLPPLPPTPIAPQ